MNRATMIRNESRMTPTISRRTLTRLAAWTLAPLTVAGLAVGAPAIAQSATELASVQSHPKSTSSMTADFVQTDRNGPRVSGTLTPTLPGKLQFQYHTGWPSGRQQVRETVCPH